MLSTAMRAEESFGPNKEEKEVVYQVPLKLDEVEKQSLLSSAVHRSNSLLHLFDPVDGPSRLSLSKRNLIETQQVLPTLNSELKFLFQNSTDSK